MRPIEITNSLSGLLGGSLDYLDMMRQFRSGPQIGPGRKTLYIAHRDVSRSRHYPAGTATNGAHGLPMAPFFVDKHHAARAIRRFQRAVARMHRLGLDADSIPDHIKRNAELARKQA